MADQPGPPLRDPFLGTSYRALRRLGGGESAEVYAVEHVAVGRELAAKVLSEGLTSDAPSADRLRLEAQTLGRLSHPSIVSVEGYGLTGEGRPFFVMELLRGRTLAQELEERGSLPVGMAVKHGIELLSALEAVHALGVVHREVTLRSVFLARMPDGAVRAKLGCFGESARGTELDAAADVHAAALVLYAMLAGRPPFEQGDARRGMPAAEARRVPAPPSSYATEPVPAELDALVLEALHPDSRKRPASARAFRERLERLQALLSRPAGWLQTTQYSAEKSDPPSKPPREARREATPPEPRQVRRVRSSRALVIAVVLALSGFIASAMAVVGVATLLRGGR